LKQIIDGVADDHFGTNVDTGNTFIAGENPADYVLELYDHVKMLHIKDVHPALAGARAMVSRQKLQRTREVAAGATAVSAEGLIGVDCAQYGKTGPILSQSPPTAPGCPSKPPGTSLLPPHQTTTIPLSQEAASLLPLTII